LKRLRRLNHGRLQGLVHLCGDDALLDDIIGVAASC
jgi:hypothetical protein